MAGEGYQARWSWDWLVDGFRRSPLHRKPWGKQLWGRVSVGGLVSVGALSTLGEYESPGQLQGASESLGEGRSWCKTKLTLPPS